MNSTSTVDKFNVVHDAISKALKHDMPTTGSIATAVLDAMRDADASRHTDDEAVDRFAVAMKQKLSAKRLDGRHGWEDKHPLHGISQLELSRMLREHVDKGDPVDVANFCMMLHQRGETIAHPAVDVKGQLATSRERARLAYPYPEDVSALVLDILTELSKARAKFPGKNVTFAAMVEEVGELATAMFEESRQRVREEAIQTAVMAMRVVLDGDHTFDDWRRDHGLNALVESPPGTAMKGDDPTDIKPDVHGHRTRYSDSSWYDEVCVLCGATDGRGDSRLEGDCPNRIP